MSNEIELENKFREQPEIAKLIRLCERAQKRGYKSYDKHVKKYMRLWEEYRLKHSGVSKIDDIPIEGIQQEVLDDLVLVDSYRKDIAKMAKDMS